METDDVLRLLVAVAEEVVNPRFRSLDPEEVGEKNPGDLVTAADHEAEELITAELRGAYPGAVVLGEEAHAGDPGLMDAWSRAEHGFTVDPVDGTRNFVHGSPDHALMVAEVLRGETVRSWIWQPQHGRAYVAERGAGAWADGRRLRRAEPPADRARWRGTTSRRRWIGRELDGLAPLELTWISCGIDYPHLVEGDADFVLYHRAAPWDHAPGGLLLAEAGGHLGTFAGDDYRPTGRDRGQGLVAAASPSTYDALVPLLPSP